MVHMSISEVVILGITVKIGDNISVYTALAFLHLSLIVFQLRDVLSRNQERSILDNIKRESHTIV